MKVYRPCDGRETAAAWISALTGTSPTALVLSRQTLPMFENTGEGALKGGYILSDSEKKTPDVILIASGSEVQLCMEAQKNLKADHIDARVVSMPCIEEFEKQSAAYRESVLPSAVRARVCVEAGSPYSWYRYAGLDGEIVGMTTFGRERPFRTALFPLRLYGGKRHGCRKAGSEIKINAPRKDFGGLFLSLLKKERRGRNARVA